ncbi:MAG: hypothetical protein DWQ10_17410 [Calditrichaeota bacterium]|nr:MAG: hypothetical protein DWQ10_17410 [Calditrichota bacterium]
MLSEITVLQIFTQSAALDNYRNTVENILSQNTELNNYLSILDSQELKETDPLEYGFSFSYGENLKIHFTSLNLDDFKWSKHYKKKQDSPTSQQLMESLNPLKRAEKMATVPENLLLVINDDMLQVKDESERSNYADELYKNIKDFFKRYRKYGACKNLHIIFSGTDFSKERQRALQSVELKKDPLKAFGVMNQYGNKILTEFSEKVKQNIFENYSPQRISYSYCYANFNYYLTFEEYLFSSLGIFYLTPEKSLKKVYDQICSAIDSDAFHQYLATVQLILLGNYQKDELFAAFERTLKERWNIRYPLLNSVEIDKKDGRSDSSFLLQTTSLENPQKKTFIHTAKVDSGYSDEFSDNRIGSHFINAERNVFIWIITSEWFEPVNDENIVESPINQQLIILGYILDSLKNDGSTKAPILHILETSERNSEYGVRPWPSFHSRNDAIAEESVKRRVPKLYEMIVTRIDDVRFHQIPWSYSGSHLDYAPRWIDALICNALGWPTEYIGETA